jgi:hypothetical protein
MLERAGVRAFGTRDMEENQSNPVSRDAESRQGTITHWHCLGSERRRAGESKVGRDQAGEGHYPQRVVNWYDDDDLRRRKKTGSHASRRFHDYVSDLGRWRYIIYETTNYEQRAMTDRLIKRE